ncbi:MAG: amidohydrolase [Planctomycetales bacterium]
MNSPQTAPERSSSDVVAACQTIMAHAWMVRTFVKHSAEVEEFPELMQVVRVIFDTARALETQVHDQPAYLHLLRKKIGKLRKAAEQFRHDAPLASGHTNFQQAVISLDGCVRALGDILSQVPAAAGPAPLRLDPPAVANDGLSE